MVHISLIFIRNRLDYLSIYLMLLAALTAQFQMHDVENSNAYGQRFLQTKNQLGTLIQFLFHSSTYPLHSILYLNFYWPLVLLFDAK